MNRETREAKTAADAYLFEEFLQESARLISIETLISTHMRLNACDEIIKAELVRRNYHTPPL